MCKFKVFKHKIYNNYSATVEAYDKEELIWVVDYIYIGDNKSKAEEAVAKFNRTDHPDNYKAFVNDAISEFDLSDLDGFELLNNYDVDIEWDAVWTPQPCRISIHNDK